MSLSVAPPAAVGTPCQAELLGTRHTSTKRRTRAESGVLSGWPQRFGTTAHCRIRTLSTFWRELDRTIGLTAGRSTRWCAFFGVEGSKRGPREGEEKSHHGGDGAQPATTPTGGGGRGGCSEGTTKRRRWAKPMKPRAAKLSTKNWNYREKTQNLRGPTPLLLQTAGKRSVCKSAAVYSTRHNYVLCCDMHPYYRNNKTINRGGAT